MLNMIALVENAVLNFVFRPCVIVSADDMWSSLKSSLSYNTLQMWHLQTSETQVHNTEQSLTQN